MLDVSDKGESHEAMEEAVLTARVKDSKQNQTVVKERVAAMDMGEKDYMTYQLGQ